MRITDSASINPDLASRGYRIVKPLGSGSFGDAWVVQSEGKMLAAKLSKGDRGRYIEKEISILRCLDHPNITKYVSSFETSESVCVVMEYAKAGDIADRITWQIQQKEMFPESTILNWFLQILMAVRYLHKKGVTHRDLKSANVFITSDNVVKLGDFGIAHHRTSTSGSRKRATTICGSPSYMAPEIISRQQYTNKVDIWSLGVILYELLTLRKPFTGKCRAELEHNITKGVYPPIIGYSHDLRLCCVKMLCLSDVERPSAKELITSQFAQKSLGTLAASVREKVVIQQKMCLQPPMDMSMSVASSSSSNCYFESPRSSLASSPLSSRERTVLSFPHAD
eukprot:TRINITY_DN2200_c0_g2_i3.p1 TRINITY_DN2200_c0_g2~~TRINITY_DN2200_c0_g2_i3.p1  ORF type:complete len:339 (+),score=34.19 TRINITY_DN2200_c0_g2_i3:53-1069(+)